MFLLGDGKIVPDKSVGLLKLGMSFSEVRLIIGDCNFKIEDRVDNDVIICEDVKVWVHREKDIVTQILVYGGFEGKYAGQIGIGSSLSDVEKILGKRWHEELDVYVLDDVPGICFELGDLEDETYWDENIAPIVSISVYKIE